MKTSLPVVALSVMIAAASPSLIQAQTRATHIGPHVSYNFDAKNLGLGAQFSVPVASQLEFYPSFDYYFVSPGSLWALNADLKYRLSREVSQPFYVGAGLNLARASAGGFSDTNAGLNLIVGAESLRGNFHPFGEIRAIVGDGSTAQIAFGLNFTLGNHY